MSGFFFCAVITIQLRLLSRARPGTCVPGGGSVPPKKRARRGSVPPKASASSALAFLQTCNVATAKPRAQELRNPRAMQETTRTHELLGCGAIVYGIVLLIATTGQTGWLGLVATLLECCAGRIGVILLGVAILTVAPPTTTGMLRAMGDLVTAGQHAFYAHRVLDLARRTDHAVASTALYMMAMKLGVSTIAACLGAICTAASVAVGRRAPPPPPPPPPSRADRCRRPTSSASTASTPRTRRR